MFNFIHTHNDKDTARFLLGEKSDNMLACLGINPSTARPGALDRTLLSVKRIAKSNDYDGYLMLNVYPQRATKPENLHKRINKNWHSQNLVEISKAIQQYKIETLWLAYGDLIETRKYLEPCLIELYEMLEPYGLDYKITGKLTAKGHPRHPLYQAAKSDLQHFELNVYLESTLKAR